MGDVADRFWARVTKGTDAECWLWNGPIHRRPDGSESYGHASLGKRGARALAHRFSYELAHGPIPAGQVVCHRCDNPRCVNPAHLFAGTKHPNAKITPEIARDIRRRRTGGETLLAIAKDVGIDQSTVHDIVRGKTWRAA